MATYLRKFVESVDQLPGELHRSFGLMRELDGQVTSLQKQVDTAAQAALDRQQGKTPAASRKRKAPDAPQWSPELEQMSAKVMQLCEEKMSLAQQTYDYVDQRIRKLDRDIKVFDGEIGKQRVLLGLPATDSGQLPDQAAAAAAAAPPVAAPAAQADAKGRAGADAQAAGTAAAAAAALPAEEVPEPVYCYCQQVSFGEMIACDNPDCPIEWFHFECVGLDPTQSRPRGKKWFCNDCAAAMKPGRRR